MDLVDRIETTRFLGAEFALWLWYQDDVFEGAHEVDGEGAVVHYDDQLQLEANLAEAERSALRGGAPAHSPEAHKALQLGKRVVKAKLRLLRGELEWLFVVDFATMRMSGVRLPSVLSNEDDEPFFERMYLLQRLEQTWLGVYERFLDVRLGSDWESTRAAIADWIAQPTGDEPVD